jgi:hypothetical protein
VAYSDVHFLVYVQHRFYQRGPLIYKPLISILRSNSNLPHCTMRIGHSTTFFSPRWPPRHHCPNSVAHYILSTVLDYICGLLSLFPVSRLEPMPPPLLPLLSPIPLTTSMAPQKFLLSLANTMLTFYFTSVILVTLGPPIYQLSIEPAQPVYRSPTLAGPIVPTIAQHLERTSSFRPIGVGVCSVASWNDTPPISVFAPKSLGLYDPTAGDNAQPWVITTPDAFLVGVWDLFMILLFVAALRPLGT